jgi:flagellin-like protein
MKRITKFKRSIRAISPVIATLLMIAIAVIASIIVYAWVTGYMGNTTNKSGNAILIQSLTVDQDSNLVAYVQNVGQGDVVLDSGYVNGDLVAQSLSISLTKGSTAAVTTTYLVTSEASLTIKIVATDGTFGQFTGYPNLENGLATTYPVVFNLGTGGASMVPSGTQSYTSGTMVAVHTLASSGYQFSSWTSTGSITFDSATSASTTAHIDGAGTITANFVAIQPSQNYQITFNLGQGGSWMTPSGTQTYAGGSSVPVRAIPLSGYHFSSWTGTGTISFDAATSISTIAHVNSAGSIKANFIATQPTQSYQVSWILGTGGSSMNPTGTQHYAGGSIVPILAIPTSGYQFSYWVSSTTSGSITFGSVTSAATTAHINGDGSVTASFIQI